MGPRQAAGFKWFMIVLLICNVAAWAAYHSYGLTREVAFYLAYLLLVDAAVVAIFALLGFITAWLMAFRLASFKKNIERVMTKYGIPPV